MSRLARPTLGLPLLLLLAASAASVEVEGGVGSLWLDPHVMADLGIEAVELDPTATPLRDGAIGLRVVDGSELALVAPGGDLEGIRDASLLHEGGFALRVGGETLRFHDLRMAAAPAPDELALVDVEGEVQLVTAAMHARLALDALRIDHADVLLAPALATRLGRPDLARTYVGVFDARLALDPASTAQHAGEKGGGCTPDIGPPVDLELFGLDLLSQGAREAGVRVAMAPRAFVRNLGPGDVAWNYAIAPDTPVGPHPYLALAFYRHAPDGSFEQIGRADAKHAFFSVNTNCPCPGDNVMYVGCEDLYGINTNLNRRFLAPRDEIDAFTGAWSSLGSHFDGPNADDQRSHDEPDHDAFEHRLVVREPDLQMPGARYFVEAWYLSAGDTTLGNSLGHVEVDPELSGSTWSFAPLAALENGPMLDWLVDPGAPSPGTGNELVDTGEGRLQLVVRTDALGGGVHRYVYTLMNFDFERAVAELRVPLAEDQVVSTTAFRDGDGDPGNDWSVSVGPTAVRWTAPLGHALDWSGLFSFELEVDAPPVPAHVRLSPATPGAPTVLRIASLAPAPDVFDVPASGRVGAGLALAVLAAAAGGVAWRRRRKDRAPAPPSRR